MKLPTSLFICVALLGGSVHAQTSWQTANRAIVKEHIVPRYAQLAEAAGTLEQQARAFCAAPGEASLDKVRQAFHRTMDGWMGIQHIRNGPVELLSRYHRFQLWPDKHNTGSRQLGTLLMEQDMEALQPGHFARGSVAVQGLSTLESLLFYRNKDVAIFGAAGQASYRCHVVEAIAHNLATMAAELAEEWRAEPIPFHTLFVSSGELLGERMKDRDLGAKTDVSEVFFNNLHTQVQAVIDQKLLRPMGESVARAKPRYTESWRSQRSLRNIQLNLEAVESLYDTGFAPVLREKADGRALDRRVRQAFAQSLAAVAAIDAPLAEALQDKQQRAEIEALLASLRELQGLLTGPLPQALDLPLGFNALDGD